LCEDDGKAVVFEFYRRTGFFQANHHVIVQNRILREHPWAALELFDAFQRSKEMAYERARRAASTYLYFPGKDFESSGRSLAKTLTRSDLPRWEKISSGRSRAHRNKGC
jgi:hypothetical protein